MFMSGTFTLNTGLTNSGVVPVGNASLIGCIMYSSAADPTVLTTSSAADPMGLTMSSAADPMGLTTSSAAANRFYYRCHCLTACSNHVLCC
jgi:hypothetical protein